MMNKKLFERREVMFHLMVLSQHSAEGYEENVKTLSGQPTAQLRFKLSNSKIEIQTLFPFLLHTE
jgi:hypothetical protein